MSKAAELAALIGSQTALSNRNLIINGSAIVSQRGDATGKTASTYGGPDRFYTIISSLGTWSISQDTDVPSGSGFSSSYKLACTIADASPAAGDHLMLHYRMEGQDLQQLKKGTSSAESVTLSFWVKCYKTGNFQVNLYDQDNTRIIGTTVTISTAATWEYKTLTFAGDTSGALGNDNNNSLFIEMVFDSGTTFSSGTVPTAWEAATNADRGAGTTVALGDSTSNYINITGVQLEVGEQATPFEHRSYGDELRRCQRYYKEWSGNIETAGRTKNGTTTCNFALEMRATPTVTFGTSYAYYNNTGYEITAIVANSAQGNLATTHTSFSSTNVGAAASVFLGNLKVDAEL